MKTLLRCCFALFAVVSATLPGRAQSVQLADGRTLLATVEDVDGQGLRVRRLDNGGVLDLRWDHLSAASATTIKKRYDLINDGQDQILVRAVEVEYTSGGAKQTMIGRVAERNADPVSVLVKGVPYRIPRRDLTAPPRDIQAPALQVLTRDEFYAERLGELQPGEKSDRHLLLAEDLIKVGDFDHAAQHLDLAKQFNNANNPGQVDVLQARLLRFKDAAKELKALEEIQVARSRGQLPDFERGLKLIAQFEKDFPQTKLKAEFDTEKRRFSESRKRFVTQAVAENYRRAITEIADKKVAENGITIDVARDFATGKMPEEIVARVASKMKLAAEEVAAMWKDRAQYPVGKRADTYAYGIGSWVLGKEGVVKGTQAAQAQAKAGAGSQKDPEVEKLLKIFKQAMQNRQKAIQAQGGQPEQITDEDWWRGASRVERSSWLRAYYAEFSGQLVVTMAQASDCISCYGEGTTPEMVEGKVVRTPCYLCQQTKYLRSLRAY